MSEGLEPLPPGNIPAPQQRVVAIAAMALDRINRIMLAVSMVALVLTAALLTYSVVSRYFFKAPTDWQDEIAVFMLVGAVFVCSSYVQAWRGHIGIEALAAIMPPAVNRVRLFLVDCASCLFCAFFSWKSWTLFHEALRDGQTTTSTFAPPLWIPYGLMAFGVTLLTLQILLQVVVRASNRGSAP